MGGIPPLDEAAIDLAKNFSGQLLQAGDSDYEHEIGANMVRCGRSVIFQMADVALPRHLFQET